jgi:hypothetical protein
MVYLQKYLKEKIGSMADTFTPADYARKVDCARTEVEPKQIHLEEFGSNILSIHIQEPLLLRILITLNNFIDMLQNLFFPLDGRLLILEPLTLTSRLNSSCRFNSPPLVILATDKSLFLFFCEPRVIAITEDVGVLARVAGDEGAGDVRVVEEGVPEGFDEFGLVEFKVAEALCAVGLCESVC